MEHGIRFAAVVMMAVAASLALSGPRLSGSVMFAGRAPWDALSVLVVVLPVYVGAVHAVPAGIGGGNPVELQLARRHPTRTGGSRDGGERIPAPAGRPA